MVRSAVLFFARSSGYESYSKRVLSNKIQNNKLWCGLNRHVLGIIRESRIDYFHFDQFKQVGINFGERITNAVDEVFSYGYQKVIIIGNDCADISSEDLQIANLSLQESSVVLGPDQRGGSYLIGIDRSVFVAHQFINLPWQTGLIFDALSKLSNNVAILQTKEDLNTAHELHSFTKKVSGNLESLLNGLTNIDFPEILVLRSYLFLLFSDSLRGPPIKS